MTLKLWQGSYKVSLLGVLAFCSTLVSTLNDSAFAQIVPDNTLGNESSSVNPDGNVKGEDATLIEGGARRDVNLLQSFSQFNVGNGQRVYFANPDGIKNILTRVTGNNVSNIFGTLGVDGNANLFLLNPNGIVFGQNARLDVAGSFLATTADSFDFGNGLEFSATDPQAAPLLSVNVTPGLQYGANPGDISSRANLIEGKELTLAGGNLDLQGEFRVSEGLILQAQDTAKVGEISAFGNSLSIEAGNKIETTGQINTSINDGKGGDIKLTSGAGGIDTRAGIVDAGSDSGEGGDITLTADGDITTATVASSISEGGIGNAGDVTINSTSGKFSLTGNEITSSASSGESGDIKITADSVSLDNARLFTEVLEGGTAGSVSVTANQSISLANESYIATGSRPFLLDFLFGGGSGGDIKLEAKSIDLKDKSRLETNSWSGGNAGNVQIKTQELTIKGGSGVLSQTFGAGRAGNVKVKYLNDKASSSVTISGVAPFAKDEQNNDIILDNDGNLTGGFSSGLFASTENQLDEDATGNGGNIDVETGHLKIQDGAAISARSRSSGNAGIIDINVDKLDITGGGQILTPALSSGKGGDINVTASGDINISGSDTEYGNRFQAIQDAFEEQGLTREDAFERTQFIVYTLGDTSSDDFDDIFLDIFGETSEVGTGFASSGLLSSSSDMGKDSGNINITSTNGSIFLRNNSEINTDIRGVGKAGNIIIEAKNGQVSFDGLYRDKDGNPILVDDLEYFIGSRVFSSLLSNAEGASGDINIEARSLDLKNRAIVDTSTFGKGKGGDINITTGSLSLDNEARLLTRTFGLASTNEQGEITSLADAGNITVNVTDKLEVLGGSQFRSDTEGQGNGGNVTVNAENAIVSFDGFPRDSEGDPIVSGISSQLSPISAEFTGVRKAGDISIFDAKEISLTNGAVLSSSTFGNGNAGNVTITANDKVSLDSSFIFSSVGAEDSTSSVFGKGGDINITTGSLSLDNEARLSTQTFGLASTDEQGEITSLADAGNITVNVTDKLEVLGGSQFRSDTEGQGNGGNVTVNAENAIVSFDGILRDSEGVPIFSGIGSELRQIEEEFTGVRKAGDISILNAKEISLTNGAQLSSSTFGKGNAGTIFLEAKDSVSLGGNSLVTTVIGKEGQGSNNQVTEETLNKVIEGEEEAPSGSIFIDAGQVSLKDSSQIDASTNGEGNTGYIIVQAQNGISLSNNSAIRNTVGEETQAGNAGLIGLGANSLSLDSGSEITTQTDGKGNAGLVLVRVDEDVSLTGEGTGIFSTVGANAESIVRENAVSEDESISGIFIEAQSLFLKDGAEISASTFGQENAGDILIEAQSLFLKDGAKINASTSGQGDAGGIGVVANNVELADGGEILTSTSSNGSAGNIKLDVENNITISGQSSSISANTAEGSEGKGGSIDIDPELVTIKDGGIVEVDSKGSGEGGDLTLTSNRLTLDNGEITAATSTSNGGDITLNLGDLLLLRENSKISATAGGAGNGGNVTIKAPNGFLVGLQNRNNDIVARASEGNGGNIEINAQSIFGFAERSSEPANQTNDIDASSDFGTQGTVELNTPDADPGSAIDTLPQDVVDPSNRIDQGCAAFDEDDASEFKVTGRGGLPPSPDQPLNSNTVWEDTRTTATNAEKLRANITAKTPRVEANKITPASGWVFKENGEVTLVSSASKATPQSLGSAPKLCPTR